MRLLVAVLALCICLSGMVQGNAVSQLMPEDPEHPGKCRYKKLAIAVDETVTEHSSCTKLTCSKAEIVTDDGQTLYYLGQLGCNHAGTWPENCYLQVADLTKNFPDCCPQLECDGPPEGHYDLVG